MGDPYSIADARSQLPMLVREAEAGEAVELTRRGRRVAVLLGIEQYERLVAARGGFGELYLAYRERYAPEDLGIDPDEVFADVRDREPGRDVSL